MKIGFLLPGTFAVGNPFNGVREQAYFQANALEAMGHEVTRLNPWNKDDLESLDLVQFFVGGPTMNGIEQRTPYPIKALVFAPIIDSNETNNSYRWAMRLGSLHSKVMTTPGMFARQAAATKLSVARSEHEKRRLELGLNVPSDKIEIVLNGADVTGVADPELARQKFDLKGDFVLHLSRYTNGRKNVLNMVHGLGKAGLPLVIAGTSKPGKGRDQIHEVAKQYGNVKFLGPVDMEARDSLYAACRVFCLPSHFEGTGLVAVEAAAFGAAVVITKNGGPPDYFLNHAEYVSRGDADEIAAATQKAWDRYGETELRERVLNTLTWTKSAKALATAYEKHCLGA